MVRLLISLIVSLTFYQSVNANTTVYSCTQNRVYISEGESHIAANQPTMSISIGDEIVSTQYLIAKQLFSSDWKIQSNNNKSIVAVGIDSHVNGPMNFYFNYTNKTYSTTAIDTEYSELSRGQCYWNEILSHMQERVYQYIRTNIWASPPWGVSLCKY